MCVTCPRKISVKAQWLGRWLQFSAELTSWRHVLNWELLNICARITVNGMQTGTIPSKNIRMSHSLVSYSFDILFLELRKNLKDFLVKGEFTACYSTFWFLCFSFLIPISLQARLCPANGQLWWQTLSPFQRCIWPFFFFYILICKQRKQQPRTLSRAQLRNDIPSWLNVEKQASRKSPLYTFKPQGLALLVSSPLRLEYSGPQKLTSAFPAPRWSGRDPVFNGAQLAQDLHPGKRAGESLFKK